MDHLLGNQTFQRSQVEYALWEVLHASRRGQMPASWPNWVRRLLDIDRQDRGLVRSGNEHAKYAFIDDVPAGKGSDNHFTFFNAFCLGVALDMSDMGFAQAEVIYLLRHVRRKLQVIFEKCVKHPMFPHQDVADDEDGRHWMVVHRMRFHKPIADSEGRAVEGPLFLKPHFYEGVAALRREVNQMGHMYRNAYFQELSRLVLDLTPSLQRAPITKRGRKK